MLKLPDVTLVLIETREHDLAELALLDCEKHVEFGDVIVFTDRCQQFVKSHRRVIEVPDWDQKVGWSKHFWHGVPPHVRTSHVLGIQWDSWVISPESWRDEFLDYDYIGSPWWYKDGMNVGNGGFSLRSTTLMRYINKHRTKYPCTTHSDDVQYCRTYRPSLQHQGFRWATVDVADYFSFECVDPIRQTFGFHGAFNFPRILPLGELIERANLMRQSPGIYESRIWKSFTRKIRESHPEIVKELVELAS